MNSIIYYVFVIIWMALYATSILLFEMTLEQWNWKDHVKRYHADQLIDTSRDYKAIDKECSEMLNDKIAEKKHHKDLILGILILVIPLLILTAVLGIFNSVWGWLFFVVFGVTGYIEVRKLKIKLDYENHTNGGE